MCDTLQLVHDARLDRSRRAQVPVLVRARVMAMSKTDIRNQWKSIVRNGRCIELKLVDYTFVAKYALQHPKLLHVANPACLRRIYVGPGAPPYEKSSSIHVVALVNGQEIDHTLSVDPILNNMGKEADDAIADYTFAKNTDRARILVEDQKKECRKAHTTREGKIACNVCKGEFDVASVDMDHIVHFDELITKFRANGQGRTTDFFDTETAKKWWDFHYENARWQPLCRQCHYRKSGDETSARAAKKRPVGVPPRANGKRSSAPAWSLQELAALQTCHDTHGHQSGKNIQFYRKALPNRSDAQIYGKGVGCSCKQKS